jgi:hypothetical protein
MRFSELDALTMRNLVAARRLSSGQTLLSIVFAVILVFGIFALLKVNSGAKQAPAKELLGSIPRSPAVRKSPSNDSMAAFLATASTQPAIQPMQSTVVDRAAVPLPRPRPVITLTGDRSPQRVLAKAAIANAQPAAMPVKPHP